METIASTEISVLGWSVVLLLLHIVLQAATASDLGPTYLMGARDDQRETRSLLSRRLKRALNNFLETYPAFIALALALVVTGKTGGMAATGAWLYLIARVVYVVIYALGTPVIRTLVWAASIIGLVLMLVRLMA